MSSGITGVTVEPNLRILVVDDNEAIHADFRKVLCGPSRTVSNLAAARAAFLGDAVPVAAPRSFEIDSAFQGQEALEKVRQAVREQRPYAMAFVDVRMPPGWDGIETVRRIWQEYPRLQVVICTAYSDYSWDKTAEVLTQTDRLLFLKKPFDNIEVRQFASALTEKWRLEREAEFREQELEKTVAQRTDELRETYACYVQSEGRYNLVAENTSDMISRHDRDGVFLFASSASRVLFDYEPAQLVGRNLFEFLSAGSATELCREQASTLAAWCEAPATYQLTRKNGGTVWVETSVRQVCDESGELREYVCTTRNVSRRKRLEQELVHSQKLEAMGRLAGGVAHDFNNLLTIILGNTELIVDDVPRDSRLREPIDEIHAAGQRAVALTEQLLTFGREPLIEHEAVDLNEVVARMERRLLPLLGDQIQMEFCLDPRLPRVNAKASQLEQILLNLALNARDAMPDGGRLICSTHVVELPDESASAPAGLLPGRYALLTVADTGQGMDEATKSRAFEPFFTTKPLGGGMGMGLALAFGIVRQFGGRIDVVSEPDAGAIFRIALPLSDLPLLAEHAPNLAFRPNRGAETLLIVDDQDAVRGLARRILAGRGYHVLEASNGAEAMRISDEYEHAIHLLVTDVIMPEMSGRQVAESLLPRRPEMKVLFVSGYTADALDECTLLNPDADYLQKPYSRDSLACRVRQLLDR